MPLSPQIVITPEDITYKSFTISAVTYTSSTATYTATGHTLNVGDVVQITGLSPDGYNGTYTITAKATNTFTVANTTNTALTDQAGNVYWADATEYEYDGGQTVVFRTNNLDLSDPNYNPAISSASQAAADAANALAQANTAIANANTALSQATIAYNAAIGSLQPSASTIVNASNQITAISTNGITVYSGSSATSGARVVMNSLGIAGFDSSSTGPSNGATFSINASTGAATFKGSITGSSITGSTLNISGNFIVDASGYLTATGATITGAITATSGSFTGTVYASAGSFTGAIYASSGYIGAATTGWNFSSSGYITNNDLTTILYPTSAANTYVLISNRGISVAGVQSSTDIVATGSAKVTGQGTSGNRCEFTYYNTIALHSISSGYGVDSDWAPNSDNTYNLGQATSAGYGANRRWARLYSNNTTISTSDVRLKTDVTVSPLGLDFIKSLRPVSYRWIVGRKEVAKDADGNPIVIGETAEGKPIFEMNDVAGVRLHYGLIAQEVKQAIDASGVEDFAGWVKDDLSDPNSTESLSYEQFIAPIIKAIQELETRISALEAVK